MVRFLFFSIAMVIASPYAMSENLFVRCNTIQNNKSYSLLVDYFNKNKLDVNDVSQNSMPESCMRLDNDEFLYTASGSGASGNLFYCNFSFSDVCAWDEVSTYIPGLKVKSEFEGANNKRYVLMSSERVRGGVYEGGYFILNLVPKKVSKRGYIIYDLKNAYSSYSFTEALAVSGDGTGTECENLENHDDARVLGKISIVNTKTKDVEIIVPYEDISCKTKEITKGNNSYRLSPDGRFISINH